MSSEDGFTTKIKQNTRKASEIYDVLFNVAEKIDVKSPKTSQVKAVAEFVETLWVPEKVVLAVYAETQQQQNELLNKEIEYAKGREKQIQKLLQERKEQKQKLLELYKTIPIDFNLKYDEAYNVGTKAQWREWLKKFEAFLKINTETETK